MTEGERRQYGHLRVIDGAGRAPDPPSDPGEWQSHGPRYEAVYETLAADRIHEIGRLTFDARIGPSARRLGIALLTIWCDADPDLIGFPGATARGIGRDCLKMPARTLQHALSDLEANGYIERERGRKNAPIVWLWRGADRTLPGGPEAA